MSRHLGLSNIYLKVGFALVVISLAVLAIALVGTSTIGSIAGQVAGFSFSSGAVLYVIGRIAQVTRSRPGA